MRRGPSNKYQLPASLRDAGAPELYNLTELEDRQINCNDDATDNDALNRHVGKHTGVLHRLRQACTNIDLVLDLLGGFLVNPISSSRADRVERFDKWYASRKCRCQRSTPAGDRRFLQ